MNTPATSSSSRPARALLVPVVAYVSAVTATFGAAAAVVGAGIPLDLLVTVV